MRYQAALRPDSEPLDPTALSNGTFMVLPSNCRKESPNPFPHPTCRKPPPSSARTVGAGSPSVSSVASWLERARPSLWKEDTKRFSAERRRNAESAKQRVSRTWSLGGALDHSNRRFASYSVRSTSIGLTRVAARAGAALATATTNIISSAPAM